MTDMAEKLIELGMVKKPEAAKVEWPNQNQLAHIKMHQSTFTDANQDINWIELMTILDRKVDLLTS